MTDLRCMICGGASQPWATKNFLGECGLGRVDYRTCTVCGFGFSAWHREMTPPEWNYLNDRYHASALANLAHEGGTDEDPKWAERLFAQANVITALWQAGLIPNDLPACDHGSGWGILSDILQTRDIELGRHEPHMRRRGVVYLEEHDLRPGGFGLVTSTAVFEHLLTLDDLDAIANLVEPNRGVLAVHTWIGPAMPRDPAWFYLLPVHVSFFTDQSIRILMDRWGFKASVYLPDVQLWFFFRETRVAEEAAGALRDAGYYHRQAEGFVTA